MEQKIEKFLDTLIWYFGTKDTPTGVYTSIGRISNSLENLNTNLIESNKSSDKLTSALNKITLFGVVISGISLLITVITLSFEIYKYFN